jgi:NAD(P)-dependent dehydrogenase (short-subunit alcohol dehydrogenase family)
MSASRPFAIVTGASTGIGFELAKRCAKEGYDLLIAADEAEIDQAAGSLRGEGTEVEAIQPTLQPPKASTSFMLPRRDARSTPFWRMPGEVSAMLFWTKIL